MAVKTRFCPSPTGLMHLGNARTALFNYLYAGFTQGEFLLRIEDTDRERSKIEYDQALQADLKWMGLCWHEGPGTEGENAPYHQSLRQAVYDDYYERLLESGLAYPCFCSEEQLARVRSIQKATGKPPRYAGTCRGLTEEMCQEKRAAGILPTLRFRVPLDEVVEFDDSVRGPQSFQSNDIGDFIIRRADGTASFMFCNAIDDALMGVTHALRGEDHLTNTPRQIMILEALGLPAPQYGHISLIVGPDGAPLSKRHGSQSIAAMREEGYLPIAINNYLGRLGHRYEQDFLLTLTELAENFRIDALSKSPARFDLSQLLFWQKMAVSQLSMSDFWKWAGEENCARISKDDQHLFAETVQPNVQFPREVAHWIDILLHPNFTFPIEIKARLQSESHPDYFKISWKAWQERPGDLAYVFDSLKTQLQLRGHALYAPLRLALTGQERGPELAKLVQLMNKECVENRLKGLL